MLESTLSAPETESFCKIFVYDCKREAKPPAQDLVHMPFRRPPSVSPKNFRSVTHALPLCPEYCRVSVFGGTGCFRVVCLQSGSATPRCRA